MDKPAVTKLFRCAIYTRKSTEHNLDLEFNSLHARSGRLARPSGASLERPALQEPLTAVRAGKVDVIVVYKVDSTG